MQEVSEEYDFSGWRKEILRGLSLSTLYQLMLLCSIHPRKRGALSSMLLDDEFETGINSQTCCTQGCGLWVVGARACAHAVFSFKTSLSHQVPENDLIAVRLHIRLSINVRSPNSPKERSRILLYIQHGGTCPSPLSRLPIVPTHPRGDGSRVFLYYSLSHTSGQIYPNRCRHLSSYQPTVDVNRKE